MKKIFLILGLVLTMLVLTGSVVMAETGSWGVGFGLPYGVLGANFGYRITPYLDLSLGLGVSPLSGSAYNIGGKLYLASEEKSFRPMLSCYYGTNTIVEEPDYYDDWGDYINYNGVTIGVGFSVTFGQAHQNGLEFNLMSRISTEANLDELKAKGYDTTSDFNDITGSIGYIHRF